MDYLLFRLYGPMASWGEIAVGVTRHTAGYPGKSAIIGLISAALGIRRDESDKQRKMQDGYAVAVEVFSHGTLMCDYHTTQVPDSVGKFKYRTRRDELIIGKDRLGKGTIISNREYRSDALAVVAVRALADAPEELETLKGFLEKPKFHLYLGRKSCPLAAPMNPVIIEKNNFFDAFKACDDSGCTKRDDYWLGLGKERHYYWEGEPSDFSDSQNLSTMQTRIRHDQPLSRTRWQFSHRNEHYFVMPGGK